MISTLLLEEILGRDDQESGRCANYINYKMDLWCNQGMVSRAVHYGRKMNF